MDALGLSGLWRVGRVQPGLPKGVRVPRPMPGPEVDPEVDPEPGPGHGP